MIREVFQLLLLVHVLCDFYVQTPGTAEKKRTSYKWVLYHSIIYAATAAVLFLLLSPGLKLRYIVLFGIFHGIVDSVKYWLCRYFFRSDRIISPRLSGVRRKSDRAIFRGRPGADREINSPL